VNVHPSERRHKVIGDWVYGRFPSFRQLGAANNVTPPTIRRWLGSVAHLEEWRAWHEEGIGPVPERYQTIHRLATAGLSVARGLPPPKPPGDKASAASDPMPDVAEVGMRLAMIAAEHVTRAGRALLHPDRLTRLLRAAAFGVPLPICWRQVGVARSTAADWQDRADADEEPFASVFTALGVAESLGRVWMHRTVLLDEKLGKQHMMMLKSRYPDDYRERREVHQTSIDRSLEDLPDSELDELLGLA